MEIIHSAKLWPGQQHSGVSDGEINLFNNATNIAQTVEVLKFLTSTLAPISNCVGIELLNEPQNDPSLPQFCQCQVTQSFASGTKFI